MKNLLPILALASCAPDPCPDQKEAMEEACERAEVVGQHDNRELYEAIHAYKTCLKEPVSVICSNIGLSGNNLTINKQ